MALEVDRLGIIRKFKPEIDERLGNLTKGVLELEDAPDDPEILASLFREAHTIKGSARMLELGAPVDLAHRMEDVFDGVRNGRLTFGAELADVLLQCIDQVTRMMNQAAEGHLDAERPPAVAELCEALDEAMGRPTESSPRPAPPRQPPAPTPEPTPTTAPATAPAPRIEQDTLRVASAKLDRFVTHSQELVIQSAGARSLLGRMTELGHDIRALGGEGLDASDTTQAPMNVRVERVEDRFFALLRDYEAFTNLMEHRSKGLAAIATEARLVPAGALFADLRRLVRDLSRALDKPVDLQIAGEETEVDKRVVDELQGALVHIVRNAVDHGLEPADARRAAGKSDAGRVRVSAAHRGDLVVIEVEDDGRGLDLAAIRSKAVERGIVTADAAATMTDEEASYLVFAAGLSTSRMLTDISGRGVGMDVVKAALERLDGQATITSTPGRGTRITLRIPLVLSVARVLLCRLADQTFALPTAALERVLPHCGDALAKVSGQDAVIVDGEALPVVDLAQVLGLPAGSRRPVERSLVVMRDLGMRVAFVVDELLSEESVLLRALGQLFGRPKGLAGATILGDGEVAIVLAPRDILRAVRRAGRAPAEARSKAPGRKANVLLVDDSVNVRELLRSMLEASDCTVVTAVDGMDGLEKARSGAFDLVVSDLEMPNMDGLELTRRLRTEATYARKPIVIVTTCETPEHRRRAMEAGASAYLVKGTFDQQGLLGAIKGFFA